MKVISNNELGDEVGDTAICPNCGKTHKIEYGEKIKKDGSRVPSRMIGAVSCGKKSFLVAIDGKIIKN